GSGVQYYGDESALAGQPVVDASGTPTRDSQGHFIVYTQSGTATEIETETATFQIVVGGQRISLLAPPLSGQPITVTVGSGQNAITLVSGDFMVSGGILTITRTTGLTAGAPVSITYTAGLATETKNETYSYEGAPQSIKLGSKPVAGQGVTVTIGGI